jgi:hypothetical protein
VIEKTRRIAPMRIRTMKMRIIIAMERTTEDLDGEREYADMLSSGQEMREAFEEDNVTAQTELLEELLEYLFGLSLCFVLSFGPMDSQTL